ncbi:hypothetical protein [Zobellia uliginosa]|uniref:hypothetical protein n=1 Tax=Zobellia uliginosa TaxID=143224 RepID=UPI001C069EEF|nr:hypothetical protein [Zobellia uliginosa]MBU2948115.1 hypothetical protein [Zobellia uliginosa]
MYGVLSQVFSNITKTGIWLVLSVFFFSNTGVDHKLAPSSFLEDSYVSNDLGIADSIAKILERSLVFESNTGVSRDGTLFTSIELKPDLSHANNEQLFGLMISKPTEDVSTIRGRHEITGNVTSFLSDFNGVFGYINVTNIDEKPYFTYKGSINITEFSTKTISGSMNLSFKNADARIIHVSKKFSAQKKERLNLQ